MTPCQCLGVSIVLSDFSKARTVEDMHAPEFAVDSKMLASTILFSLSGGLTPGAKKLQFPDIMKAADAGFSDDSAFDRIKADRAELQDLLRVMVTGAPLLELLERPYFWTRERRVAYLGEDIGNLLDPGATGRGRSLPLRPPYSFSISRNLDG